jgi:hypothetical protein
MVEFLLVPFRIIGLPFRLASLYDQAKARKYLDDRKARIENFKKNLDKDDADLLVETDDIFILGASIEDIQEQINLYKMFKRNEIDKRYLRPDILESAHRNNSLYLINKQMVDELRK